MVLTAAAARKPIDDTLAALADPQRRAVLGLLRARPRPAGDLVRAALGADKALVNGALVFDVYRGPGVPEGAKSVAIEVTLQPSDRTLTDADIDQVSAKIVMAVEKTCGGRLRA